jgi:transcriptional regulator with XRE-family HTH domain
MKTFGQALREVRVAKKLTLRDISRKVGKSIGYLSDIEHGRKRPPDLETVRKIEEFIGAEDGSLVESALKLRSKLQPEVTELLKMRPRLSQLLLRAEAFTDDELEKAIKDLEKGRRVTCQER